VLRSGGQALVLTNGGNRELLIRVERTVARDDALTAARASALAQFRELFPDEVLAPGQVVSIATVTLLATALNPDQVDVLYKSLGDARAFGVILEHLHALGDAVSKGGGALIKTMDEGVLAAFGEPENAVEVGLDLQEVLSQRALTRDLRLRAGIHRGPAVAATFNDHLDYFGSISRQTMRLLPLARDGDLVLTGAVAGDPGVAALLHARGLEGQVFQGDLAGETQVLLRLRAADREIVRGDLASAQRSGDSGRTAGGEPHAGLDPGRPPSLMGP
jgi:hypothetical protein